MGTAAVRCVPRYSPAMPAGAHMRRVCKHQDSTGQYLAGGEAGAGVLEPRLWVAHRRKVPARLAAPAPAAPGDGACACVVVWAGAACAYGLMTCASCCTTPLMAGNATAVPQHTVQAVTSRPSKVLPAHITRSRTAYGAAAQPPHVHTRRDLHRRAVLAQPLRAARRCQDAQPCWRTQHSGSAAGAAAWSRIGLGLACKPRLCGALRLRADAVAAAGVSILAVSRRRAAGRRRKHIKQERVWLCHNLVQQLDGLGCQLFPCAFGWLHLPLQCFRAAADAAAAGAAACVAAPAFCRHLARRSDRSHGTCRLLRRGRCSSGACRQARLRRGSIFRLRRCCEREAGRRLRHLDWRAGLEALQCRAVCLRGRRVGGSIIEAGETKSLPSPQRGRTRTGAARPRRSGLC